MATSGLELKPVAASGFRRHRISAELGVSIVAENGSRQIICAEAVLEAEVQVVKDERHKSFKASVFIDCPSTNAPCKEGTRGDKVGPAQPSNVKDRH